MSSAGARVGVGARFRLDGGTVEVVEIVSLLTGMETVLRDGRGRVLRMSVRELLTSGRAQVVADGPGPSSDDPADPAAVALAGLSEPERVEVLERAAHVREMLEGYRAGCAELAAPGEPRAQFAPGLPLAKRYAAKAQELGVTVRTLERWAACYRKAGEAGLVLATGSRSAGGLGRADPRWVEMAVEVLAEHVQESTPSGAIVLDRVHARLDAKFGAGEVKTPSRATGYRWLVELERRYPTFRLSAKRNREIAGRPGGVYGKLCPTRPGEYLLMDTTRLDVFALDPATLRWMQAELTVAMDWYTRCICGIRVTAVSTKAADAAAVLFQVFQPRPADPSWPADAAWPEHGIPRTVVVDRDGLDGPLARAAGPALVPETLVLDHGKVYVSEHLTSVCQRMGISIQPARLRTGRDKGPIERFFRTLREDLLQALPGYKGPDIHARGLTPESDAFFFHHELEAIIREWVATVYHHRQHSALFDPHASALRFSPAKMFEHGLARAGYIEVPRDPDLAYEFLKIAWRSIQHYGVEIDGRRYNGPALSAYRQATSPHSGVAKGRWPIAVHPDDVTRAYFRDPVTRRWHTLWWEHAASLRMPLSEDALRFARKLAASTYTYPDDKLAAALLLERWNLGLGSSLAERRIALRLAREQAAPQLPGADSEPPVAALPSVARVLELPAGQREPDESDADIDAEPPEEDRDFYADSLEDVDD